MVHPEWAIFFLEDVMKVKKINFNWKNFGNCVTITDVFVALYDFNNGEPSCLVLTKGHKYKILQRSNKDWWYAIDLHSREPHLKGFVPFNYVVQCDTLEAQE